MKYSHRFYERYVLDNELTKEKKNRIVNEWGH